MGPIKCHISARRGRLCNSGVVPTGHLGTLCHNSFRSKAATIFNCLPKHIRDLVNCANTSIFKRALDYHLCSIEDSPMVPNECNSLTSRSKENAINMKWSRGGLQLLTKLNKQTAEQPEVTRSK